MVDAQSPVAIRALPDLCLGIIFQLGHLRLPTNLVQNTRIDHPQRRSAAATAGMNSSRARDDATLIPNLGDEFVEHGPRPCRSTGFAFFRPTKLEQDNGTGRIEVAELMQMICLPR
jgi:hypothetical protein